MKKTLLMVIMGFFLITLSGCNSPNFPRIHYEHSGFTYDSNSRYIHIKDGYVLSQTNPYNEMETENGYDIVIHCVKEN